MPRLTQAMGEGLKGVGLEKELEAGAGAPERIVWDSQLKGFGLRLFTSGRRSWLVQYRAAGRQRRISLGDAAVVTMGEARTKARQLLAQSDLGRDPQAQRQAARRSLTVRQLIDLYLERQARPRLKARSLVEIERHLLVKAKALHPLGATQSGARTWHGCWRGCRQRTRAGEPGAGEPDRDVRLGGGARAGRGEPGGRGRQAHRREGAGAGAVTRRAGGGVAARGRGNYARVVRLILLTAARRDEVGGMRCGEVDEDGLWVLPAERSKNGRPIDRPLPIAARQLLPKREAGAGAVMFGFWAEAATAVPRLGNGQGTADRADREGKGSRGLEPLADWTLHDLRRSVATALGELEMAMPHVVETLLGHRHEKQARPTRSTTGPATDPGDWAGAGGLGRAPDGAGGWGGADWPGHCCPGWAAADGRGGRGQKEKHRSPTVVSDYDPAEHKPQVGRGRPGRRGLKSLIHSVVGALIARGVRVSYQPRSRMVKMIIDGLNNGQRHTNLSGEPEVTSDLHSEPAWIRPRKGNATTDEPVRLLIECVIKEDWPWFWELEKSTRGRLRAGIGLGGGLGHRLGHRLGQKTKSKIIRDQLLANFIGLIFDLHTGAGFCNRWVAPSTRGAIQCLIVHHSPASGSIEIRLK